MNQETTKVARQTTLGFWQRFFEAVELAESIKRDNKGSGCSAVANDVESIKDLILEMKSYQTLANVVFRAWRNSEVTLPAKEYVKVRAALQYLYGYSAVDTEECDLSDLESIDTEP